MEPQPIQPFRVGRWRVDPRLDVISCDGAEVKLVPKTMEVLCCLARHPGELVTQEEIENTVWPNVVVTSSSVYQAIADLRRVLGDTRQPPTYIATVPRKGYRLIAPVTPDAPAAAQQPPAQPASSQPAGAAGISAEGSATAAASRSRTPVLATVATLAVAVIAVAAVWMLRPSGEGDAGAVDPRSIAVLPVADFSEQGNEGHFADGLTEEMLNTLAQIPGLHVTARTSAFVFKDRHADVREIGRELGTRYVLEGSVRRGNGRIRVTAQLVDARNGYHLWSKTYERPIGDVLVVQEEIARAVAESLRVTLSGESMSRLTARRTVNVNSYELYLLGRHYQLERNPEAMRRAIDYQQQAVAADPAYALAYAGLAEAHMYSFYDGNRPLAEVTRAIEPLIAKGLQLNPQLPELYVARALLRTEQLRLQNAEQDLKRAIELNPNYAEAYVRLGAAYEYDGRPREALDAYSKAAALDPLHFVLQIRRCIAFQNLGRYAEATSACNRAIALESRPPNAYWARGLMALSSGDLPRAIRGYREALAHAPRRVDLMGQLGWLYLDAGLTQQAEEQFAKARSIAGVGPSFAYLAGTRLFVATHDAAGLRAFLSPPDVSQGADFETLLDLALMELLAERPDEARAYYARAIAAPDFVYARLFNTWNARWGFSDLLTLAIMSDADGDHARADLYLADLSAYLDRLERNGHIWHGLHYLRADVRALQRRPDEALAELVKATRLGWRRAWWPRVDPALVSLRGDARFEEWLRSLEAANRPLRAQVLSMETPDELQADASASQDQSDTAIDSISRRALH